MTKWEREFEFNLLTSLLDPVLVHGCYLRGQTLHYLPAFPSSEVFVEAYSLPDALTTSAPASIVRA